jgi:hypothetical protein
MKPRSIPQNRKLSAIVSDVQRRYPLVPWKAGLAREAWKRHLIAIYIREARLEAYANGQPDPFPVRPVPSSSLESWQMNELIECALWYACEHLSLILE